MGKAGQVWKGKCRGAAWRAQIFHPAILIFLACLLTGMTAGLFFSGCASPRENAETNTSEVRIAAAADLRFALDEIQAEFKKQYPYIDVKIVYGSSGNFFVQLQQQAPFDVYLSADLSYPRRLVEQGVALKETEFLYGVGRLVVWMPEGGIRLDVDALGLQALTDPAARKIAIANPQHAPYGRAAEAALRHYGVYEAVQDRLVFGESVAQTAHFIETGAADAGIIALALALSPEMRKRGRFWMIPLEAYPRIEQGGVILSWAQDLGAAKRFRDFMLGPAGRAILERYGFFLPEGF